MRVYSKCISIWLPVIVWMGVIFIFSTRQRVAVSPDYTANFIFFKSLHLVEYAILGFLLFRAYKKTFVHASLGRIIWYALITALVYAASDEIHQLFVPTRQGTLRDVGIDMIGVSCAILYTKLHLNTFRKWI